MGKSVNFNIDKYINTINNFYYNTRLYSVEMTDKGCNIVAKRLCRYFSRENIKKIPFVNGYAQNVHGTEEFLYNKFLDNQYVGKHNHLYSSAKSFVKEKTKGTFLQADIRISGLLNSSNNLGDWRKKSDNLYNYFTYLKGIYKNTNDYYSNYPYRNEQYKNILNGKYKINDEYFPFFDYYALKEYRLNVKNSYNMHLFDAGELGKEITNLRDFRENDITCNGGPLAGYNSPDTEKNEENVYAWYGKMFKNQATNFKLDRYYIPYNAKKLLTQMYAYQDELTLREYKLTHPNDKYDDFSKSADEKRGAVSCMLMPFVELKHFLEYKGNWTKTHIYHNEWVKSFLKAYNSYNTDDIWKPCEEDKELEKYIFKKNNIDFGTTGTIEKKNFNFLLDGNTEIALKNAINTKSNQKRVMLLTGVVAIILKTQSYRKKQPSNSNMFAYISNILSSLDNLNKQINSNGEVINDNSGEKERQRQLTELGNTLSSCGAFVETLKTCKYDNKAQTNNNQANSDAEKKYGKGAKVVGETKETNYGTGNVNVRQYSEFNKKKIND